MGLPLMKPCNLPKAIKLPVNVNVPTNTAKTIVLAKKIVCWEVPYLFNSSAVATSAEAPPPKPLKIATI